MLACYYGCETAVVNLDWHDDSHELCLQHLVSHLAELEDCLTDMFVGRPELVVSRVNMGALYRPMPAVMMPADDRSGVARCSIHPDRPAVVILDYGYDHYAVCPGCIVTELDAYDAHACTHDGCCEPFRPLIRTVGTNPHRPRPDDADTVLCVGCGHRAGRSDELATNDDPMAPDGVVSWHVDCFGPASPAVVPSVSGPRYRP